MNARHAKSVRRQLLTLMYEAFMADPLRMMAPVDFFDHGLDKHDLAVNMHYLMDAKLAEVMLGYTPPLFTGARITPAGIDLVEHTYAFDLRFPPKPDHGESLAAQIPTLVEQLVDQAELCPMDLDHRHALLRDVNYIRSEIARPVGRWRWETVSHMLELIGAAANDPDEELPALTALLKQLPRVEKELAERAGD